MQRTRYQSQACASVKGLCSSLNIRVRPRQVMNAELMAVLDEGEGRSQLLEASLQEKESQLTQLTELQKVSSLRHSTCPCCCMTASHALGTHK